MSEDGIVEAEPTIGAVTAELAALCMAGGGTPVPDCIFRTQHGNATPQASDSPRPSHHVGGSGHLQEVPQDLVCAPPRNVRFAPGHGNPSVFIGR